MTRIVFAGTPEFALAPLSAMVDAGIRPLAVLTQPDRPAGRGKKLKASPVKQYALSRQLDVWQPESLRDDGVAEYLRALNVDLFIVAAYGLLLPQNILDIPRIACVNVHGSLLPRWRGAAPVQAAILAGDAETGISLMKMDAGLDTGPVYATSSIAIGNDETAGELHDRLATLGGQLLAEKFGAIASGNCEPQPQDAVAASYAAKMKSCDAQLDWTMPAAQLQRMIRAYNPVPGAWTQLAGERTKIWRARLARRADKTASQPGAIVDAGAEGIVIACGEDSLLVTELQRPGRNRISAAEFASQCDISSLCAG